MDRSDIRVQTSQMGDVEHMIRLAFGSAAAGAAIFAPLSYPWKGVLTAAAAGLILTAIYEVAPLAAIRS